MRSSSHGRVLTVFGCLLLTPVLTGCATAPAEGGRMTETADRDRQVRRVILIEGGANLLVLFAKLAVGLTTGSLAILSDAVHSLTDVVNNILAWFIVMVTTVHSTQAVIQIG